MADKDETRRQAENERIMTLFLKAHKGGRQGRVGELEMCGCVQGLSAEDNGIMDFLNFVRKKSITIRVVMLKSSMPFISCAASFN